MNDNGGYDAWRDEGRPDPVRWAVRRGERAEARVAVGATSTDANGQTWQWDGRAWVCVGGAS
jgi:hypothetical protein